MLAKLMPPLYVVLATLALLLISLSMNDGHFVYALDDPYIHLDLADQLWRTGIYGVNEGQYAAPSSSILWPELLFIGVGTSWHVYVPLALAWLASVLSAALLYPLVKRILRTPPHITSLLATALAIVLCLPALALSGMEHSLQVLLTLLAALGLIRFHEEGKVPRWLWLVIFLGPLVRYENVLVSFGALAILFHQGQRRQALLWGTLVLASLAAFTAFLLAHGLDAVPSSTIVKRLRTGTGYWAFWKMALMIIMITPMAWLMLLLGGWGGLWALRYWNWSDRRWFATAIMAGMVLMHLFIGRFGGADFPRYELYLFGFLIIYAGWHWRHEFIHLCKKPPMVGFLTLWGFLLLGPALLGTFDRVLPAMRAIYLQQEQMGRLAHEFWKKPIGVNDIGIVGYRNPHYVFDLAGLADRQARIAAWTPDPNVFDQYVRSKNVDLLILYRRWYSEESRKTWTPIGELFRPRGLTTFGDPSVLFMTPYAEKAESIKAELRAWANTLPRDTLYVEYGPNNPAPVGNESPPPPAPLRP